MAAREVRCIVTIEIAAVPNSMSDETICNAMGGSDRFRDDNAAGHARYESRCQGFLETVNADFVAGYCRVKAGVCVGIRASMLAIVE
jgi:hypothetical protein